MKFEFQGQLNKDPDQLYYNHILVPNEITDQLLKVKEKRILCQIDDHKPFHAGLISNGKGQYFIIINKNKIKKYKLQPGKPCTVLITKDESQYGMNLPEEMAELFNQDPEGSDYFHNLTPGKQRGLLYIVDKVKSPRIRLIKALIIMEHLKEQRGILDYKVLNQDLKNKKDILT
jgi:hypothetical protein